MLFLVAQSPARSIPPYGCRCRFLLLFRLRRRFADHIIISARPHPYQPTLAHVDGGHAVSARITSRTHRTLSLRLFASALLCMGLLVFHGIALAAALPTT